MNQDYYIDYFIKKFEQIPEDMWCTELYTDNFGRCCARGHCGDGKIGRNDELRSLFEVLGKVPLTTINDGFDSRYQQPVIKDRVLAALRDIKSGKLDAKTNLFTDNTQNFIS